MRSTSDTSFGKGWTDRPWYERDQSVGALLSAGVETSNAVFRAAEGGTGSALICAGVAGTGTASATVTFELLGKESGTDAELAERRPRDKAEYAGTVNGAFARRDARHT